MKTKLACYNLQQLQLTRSNITPVGFGLFIAIRCLLSWPLCFPNIRPLVGQNRRSDKIGSVERVTIKYYLLDSRCLGSMNSEQHKSKSCEFLMYKVGSYFQFQ
jgi:hypothetical protein